VASTSRDAFLESLMDTNLYYIGAAIQDTHPHQVDDVLAEAEEIESVGLHSFAAREGLELETAFQTLVTGLAVRYYRAVTG
jgi:hypothetical protein